MEYLFNMVEDDPTIGEAYGLGRCYESEKVIAIIKLNNKTGNPDKEMCLAVSPFYIRLLMIDIKLNSFVEIDRLRCKDEIINAISLTKVNCVSNYSLLLTSAGDLVFLKEFENKLLIESTQKVKINTHFISAPIPISLYCGVKSGTIIISNGSHQISIIIFSFNQGKIQIKTSFEHLCNFQVEKVLLIQENIATMSVKNFNERTEIKRLEIISDKKTLILAKNVFEYESNPKEFNPKVIYGEEYNNSVIVVTEIDIRFIDTKKSTELKRISIGNVIAGEVVLFESAKLFFVTLLFFEGNYATLVGNIINDEIDFNSLRTLETKFSIKKVIEFKDSHIGVIDSSDRCQIYKIILNNKKKSAEISNDKTPSLHHSSNYYH